MLGAMVGQEVPNKRSRQAMNQLLFFMTASVAEEWIFRFGNGCRQGLAGRPWEAARPAVDPASDGAQVASPQSPILR